ncbi:ketopantoate reductase family protein [Jeotgalibacillus haloalkalitolerans]|uniref:2-dehydropantoate 2-reductase n=1 Tax=Jeotgalibacillus haloalkalitolerans TaxID=3104292 RepID=A0ABU5KPR7_9BACL|nr:ketopantoate reductase family protein [Jeotgalibacillus sp. HH7-29]MDZ5713244.1 ketopantoate reductase family protein [Jeotgalibacillus sp. HH7-29]
MNILIAGAGGIGGYFGGRLMEKGQKVTFLVRENRKKQLEKTDLVIESPHGNFTGKPDLITKDQRDQTYDAIIITTKAYHLEEVINDIKPFADESTLILPLLNGIAHMEPLIEAFGERVIGGLCFIETTLNAEGHVIQSSPIHDLVYGERDGSPSERIMKLQEAFEGAHAGFTLSENIMQDMWHKYSFITAMSGITTLMRSPIGPAVKLPAARQTLERLLHEISAVMHAIDAPIAEGLPDMQMAKMEEMKDEMKSSMLRDMEKGLQTETSHLQGWLLGKGKENGLETPVLEAAFAHVKIYESLKS